MNSTLIESYSWKNDQNLPLNESLISNLSIADTLINNRTVKSIRLTETQVILLISFISLLLLSLFIILFVNCYHSSQIKDEPDLPMPETLYNLEKDATSVTVYNLEKGMPSETIDKVDNNSTSIAIQIDLTDPNTSNLHLPAINRSTSRFQEHFDEFTKWEELNQPRE